jgi:hypothetical protein
MNMKEIQGNDQEIETPSYTTLTQLLKQEQLLLYLLYTLPAKHVYLASKLLPRSQTVCPPLRLYSLD